MLQALGDNIIVKPVYEKKISSLFIPETAVQFKKYEGFVYGDVISVGPKVCLKFERNSLVPGDKVIWQRHEGLAFKFEGEEYLKVKSKWIMGKIIPDAN